jgi:hypothetical protein
MYALQAYFGWIGWDTLTVADTREDLVWQIDSYQHHNRLRIIELNA